MSEVHEPRVRRPVTVAILGAATLGIYSIGWYYRIHREMRDFGTRQGDRELGATSPWMSAIAMTLGGIIVIPRLISFLRAAGRIQSVERLAAGSERPAVGLSAGLAVAALLPIGGSAHRFGPLLASVGFLALIASTARMQARLNAAWVHLPAPARQADAVRDTSATTFPNRPKPARRSRSIDDLLARADQQRRGRVAQQQVDELAHSPSEPAWNSSTAGDPPPTRFNGDSPDPVAAARPPKQS